MACWNVYIEIWRSNTFKFLELLCIVIILKGSLRMKTSIVAQILPKGNECVFSLQFFCRFESLFRPAFSVLLCAKKLRGTYGFVLIRSSNTWNSCISSYTSLTKSLYIPLTFPLKLAISIMAPGLFHSTAMPQEELELGLWGELYLNFSPRQGTKLHLIQSPMRLKLLCWRPRFKS